MMISKKLSVLCLALLTAGSAALAQRAVTSAYQLGAGTTDILDTYLSQEKFSGAGLTFLATREWQKGNSRWTTLTEHELNFATAEDRAGSREELQADYSLFVGRLYGWQWGRLTLQAGGMVAANVGVVYNTSNSNNLAQARLSLQLMPTGAAAYDITLFRRTLRLSYELQLPLAGVMFCPNYGQSYYEIFSLGNYDHNVVPMTLVSAPNFRQQIAAEYPVTRHVNLRLGYLGHYQQAEANNLKSHIYSHRVMIGVVRNFTIFPR